MASSDAMQGRNTAAAQGQTSAGGLQAPDASAQDGSRLAALVGAALDLGELLLTYGAEVSRVEDTIRRVCYAYGADPVEVFTITTSIVVTANFPGYGSITQTRRIRGISFQLEALERLNDLSRQACSQRMEPEELHERLDAVRTMKPHSLLQDMGIWVLIASSLSLFFGGNPLDAVCAGVIGAILFVADRVLSGMEINSYLVTVLLSLLGGLLSNLVLQALHLPVNPAMINIGIIMLLIPGVAFTGSIRDMFSGDTISGLMRASEALVLSIAIAWGFALTAGEAGEAAAVSRILQVVTATVGTLGYALRFHARARHLPWCMLGGMLAWGAVLLFQSMGVGEVTSYFLASVVLAVYSQILARVRRCPATVFLVTASIPLIPGGGLYQTMRYAMDTRWDLFIAQGLQTLLLAVAIAAGMLIVQTCVHGAGVCARRLRERPAKTRRRE